ncbi:hypothetical protein DFH07DRAFT_971973 [Mycena maculata]|uniref:Uncharacterized protein n=1 Tax=Mycena maculata TaxID=230809 RepID=A0AAD7MLK3_9AGAR|nr:hypothetical protein DFH07DRAFT_971973 [Mycena maculata]
MSSESPMDGTNRPSAQSDFTSQNRTSSPTVAAPNMDVDIDVLDYGGGTSPTPTLDFPDATSKGEQGTVAFTRDGERRGDMEVMGIEELSDTVTTDVGTGSKRMWRTLERMRKMEMKLVIAETRLDDTKKELFDERQCAARAIAEWSAERERLKAQIEKLFDERDELRDRVASMKKDYEELKEDNETTLAECVQLREELDRVRDGRDNERDRKRSRTQGPPSEDGKGKNTARSDLVDKDSVMQEVGNTSSNGVEGDSLTPHEKEIRDCHLPSASHERSHRTLSSALLRDRRRTNGIDTCFLTTSRRGNRSSRSTKTYESGRMAIRYSGIYLYSKEVPTNRRSDLQKYAVDNYKLYDWVSDILDAVGNNREPPSNSSAVQRYLKCSTSAITTYDPIEPGRVIQYRQHSNVPGVEPLDDCWTLSKRHLRGAMLRQMVLPHHTGKSEGVDQRAFQYSIDTLLLEAMGVPGWYYARLIDFNIQVASELKLKQWEWLDNLSPVTEREFVQHLADLGVGIRLLEDGCDYTRDLLMTMANSPQPMKHSDWTQQAAIDIYERTRETEMPRYTVAAEDDVLLRNPTLPYPAKSEYVPGYHMYEWAHPDVRGIPREDGSRIQRAISQNKCRLAKPENCMNRVYSITPFAMQRRDVHEPRRIEQSLQGTSLAYNISPTHPLAPRAEHRSHESTANATVISRSPRSSTNAQSSAPFHHRSLANRIGPDTTGHIPSTTTRVTVPRPHGDLHVSMHRPVEPPTEAPLTPRASTSALGLQTTTMETLDAAPNTNFTNDGESLEYWNGFMDSSE